MQNMILNNYMLWKIQKHALKILKKIFYKDVFVKKKKNC